MSSSSSSFLEWIAKVCSSPQFRYAEHAVVLASIAYFANRARQMKLSSLIDAVPGARAALNQQIEQQATEAVDDLFKNVPRNADELKFSEIPLEGFDKEAIIAEMSRLRSTNVDMHNGKGFAYVYDTTQKDFTEALDRAFSLYMHENALNPVAFPALRKFEVEVLSMVMKLHHATEDVCGTMSSGGTESILCAVKSYRQRARDLWPHITAPEMVLPITAHPAFEKAAHYFDVKAVHAPVSADMRASPAEMEKLITPNTILIVGSAPQYPHGVVDPIAEIGAMAAKRNLPFHVDACVGGFILPWLEKLGYPIPVWDWRVPGVTSISADLHKYGFASKGASTITYRNNSYRKYQFFSYCGWPGGLFTSPSMLGTRPGGSVAGAWAALTMMGEKGYLDLFRGLMELRDKIIATVNDIPELEMVASPDVCIVSFKATVQNVNVLAVADVMEDKFDWKMERQTKPDSIHMSLMPPHINVVDSLLSNLREAVEEVKQHPELSKKGTAAMYGNVATIPDGTIVEDFLTSFIGKVYQTK